MNHCYVHARESHKNCIGRVGETSCCNLLPMLCHVHTLQGNEIRHKLLHIIIITITTIVTAIFITAVIVAWINCEYIPSIVHDASFLQYRFSVSPYMLMATSSIIFHHTPDHFLHKFFQYFYRCVCCCFGVSYITYLLIGCQTTSVAF